MSNSTPVRVAVVGVGGIATKHLTNLLRMPEAEVVALVDVNLERIPVALEHASANQTPPISPPTIDAFDDV